MIPDLSGKRFKESVMLDLGNISNKKTSEIFKNRPNKLCSIPTNPAVVGDTIKSWEYYGKEFDDLFSDISSQVSIMRGWFDEEYLAYQPLYYVYDEKSGIFLINILYANLVLINIYKKYNFNISYLQFNDFVNLFGSLSVDVDYIKMQYAEIISSNGKTQLVINKPGINTIKLNIPYDDIADNFLIPCLTGDALKFCEIKKPNLYRNNTSSSIDMTNGKYPIITKRSPIIEDPFINIKGVMVSKNWLVGTGLTGERFDGNIWRFTTAAAQKRMDILGVDPLTSSDWSLILGAEYQADSQPMSNAKIDNNTLTFISTKHSLSIGANVGYDWRFWYRAMDKSGSGWSDFLGGHRGIFEPNSKVNLGSGSDGNTNLFMVLTKKK